MLCLRSYALERVLCSAKYVLWSAWIILNALNVFEPTLDLVWSLVAKNLGIFAHKLCGKLLDGSLR